MEEEHRGVINGVQNAVSQKTFNSSPTMQFNVSQYGSLINYNYSKNLQMNSFLDTIKFALVIVLPNEETFGYLIMASFSSIVLGAVSYTSYVIKSNSQRNRDLKVPPPEGITSNDTAKEDAL